LPLSLAALVGCGGSDASSPDTGAGGSGDAGAGQSGNGQSGAGTAGTGGASAGGGQGGAGAAQGGAGSGQGGAGKGGAGQSQGGAGQAQGGAGQSQGGAGQSQGGAGQSQGGAGSGGSPVSEPDVVQCGATLAPAADGVCDVVKGSGMKRLRGRVIAPDHIYEGGEVIVDDKGIIQCVGCDCSGTPGAADATTVTCADGVISPSLINTHDHITYAQLAPRTHPGVKYDHRHEWRKGLNGKPKLTAPSGSPTASVVSWGELRFVLGGATSTTGSGSSAGLMRNIDKSGAPQEGLNEQAAEFDTFPLNDSKGTLDTTCVYSGFTAQTDVDKQVAYLPHIAEGVIAAAHNEFACTNGGMGSQVDYLKPQTAMIHAIGLNSVDYAGMASDGTGLIWSPRSNIDLYGFTADVTAASRLGVQISLGTDWSASGSMNLLRELQCADSYNQAYLGGFFSDYRLYRMVTEDAAALVASDDKIGALKVGHYGDITIWNGAGKPPFAAVIRATTPDVALVLRGGLVLHGEGDLVTALSPDGGAGCEDIDVCGSAKKICAKRETGKTIADLKASISGELYDLFFCDTPKDEPSCVPSRPNEFTGTPAAGTDSDGDGIPDTTDLCPSVFSAPRPMDAGKQLDADGDGLGDACDPCPLKANSEDCPLVQGDVDGDTVPDAKDNCPSVANTDQADMDKDGKGDACDPCPTVANPGAQACPAESVTIAQAIAKGDGAVVSIDGVCVSALHPSSASTNAFWIQDPQATENGGLYVFLSKTAIPVAELDQVQISGTLSLYQGLLELTAPTVTKTGTCQPLVPILVDNPADLATGGAKAAALTSMLVEVKKVAVVNANPDDPKNFNEFAVTGNLRVDDFIYPYTMGSFAVGTTFSSVTGIATFTFSNNKVLPRTAADLVSP
jgi:hypothetical protein